MQPHAALPHRTGGARHWEEKGQTPANATLVRWFRKPVNSITSPTANPAHYHLRDASGPKYFGDAESLEAIRKETSR